MPSSLTRVLPRAFVSSTRPPVSVSGTGTLSLARGFSWQCDPQDFGTVLPSPSQLTVQSVRICLHAPLTAWTASSIRPLPWASCVTPLAQTEQSGAGISTSSPSTTPLGLALGPDLPWADDPSPGTLGLSAEGILTPLFATYTGILSCVRSTIPLRTASPPTQRSPTMLPITASQASVASLAPLHFPRSATRPVSYYALFQ